MQIRRFQGLQSKFCCKSYVSALHVKSSWCLLSHECFLNFLQEKRNRG